MIEIQQVIALVKEAKKFVENREMVGNVEVKGPADYVTQVDKSIEEFLCTELGKLAPEIQFMGEEEGLHEMKCDCFWILDPIDGTTNLIHDYKHSVISLGLYDKGEIVMGIIYDPFREEVFYAEKGKGAFCNGKPMHVSAAEALSQTIVAFGSSPYEKYLATENFARCQRVFEQSQDIRRTASAAMDLAYVACGRTGGYFEVVLRPWDFAAGSLLVTEAGGTVTDFEGKPLDFRKKCSLVATNGKVHEELKALM